MKTINNMSGNEIVIEKSRFITTLIPVKSINDINTALSSLRKKYFDATHNCYAYILGSMAEIKKASDDGEPSKTAGMPMLNVLEKNNLTNILAVTTRYFGGTLLGAGGLVRAYSNSVIEALKNTTLYEMTKLQKVIISVDYPSYSLLEDELKKFDVISSRFAQTIDITLGISLDLVDDFKILFNNVTRGKGLFIIDNIYDGIKKA